jgi:predicted unusual protein kinase regulating ubiquinone biosynthesis (AarF/ABC1/UbiB family)
MAFGAVGESLRRATGSAAASGGSLMLSPGNIELLVAKLSRMRGAALKLGQMISIQGESCSAMRLLHPVLTVLRHQNATSGHS